MLNNKRQTIIHGYLYLAQRAIIFGELPEALELLQNAYNTALLIKDFSLIKDQVSTPPDIFLKSMGILERQVYEFYKRFNEFSSDNANLSLESALARAYNEKFQGSIEIKLFRYHKDILHECIKDCYKTYWSKFDNRVVPECFKRHIENIIFKRIKKIGYKKWMYDIIFNGYNSSVSINNFESCIYTIHHAFAKYVPLEQSMHSRKLILPILGNLLQTNNPTWDPGADAGAIERQLNDGVIWQIMDMRMYLQSINKIARFSGEVYVVLLNNGVKAVWKPRDNTRIMSVYAEQVAFRASAWLKEYSGVHLVPPTIIKSYQGRIGSLQYYIESPLDLWDEHQRGQALAALDPDDLANAVAFIHTFGQWDSHSGNQIAYIGEHGSTVLGLIDNEYIVSRQYSPDMKHRPYVHTGHVMQGIDVNMPDQEFTLIKPTKQQLDQALSNFKPSPYFTSQLYEIGLDFGNCDLEYMVRANGLWIRYHKDKKEMFPNQASCYPQYLIDAYTDLDMDTLHEIFQPAIEVDSTHFNNAYLGDILSRARQLLDVIAAQDSADIVNTQSPIQTGYQSLRQIDAKVKSNAADRFRKTGNIICL